MEDVTTSPIGRLRVATLGAESRQVADVHGDLEQLRWNSRGDSVYFVVKEQRVISGKYSDWDIPQAEVLAHRIMRVDVAGGDPGVVVEAMERITFQLAERADVLVYQRDTAPNGAAELLAIDLRTGALSTLLANQVLTAFDVAADGATIACGTVDLQQGGASALSLVSRSNGERILVQTEGLGGFGWLDTERLLVMEHVGEAGRTMRLRTVSKSGARLASVDVEGEGMAYAPGLGTSSGLTSPDGKWMLTAGKGEGLQVVSVDTGRVYRSPYVGWEGWLDAQTLIGTFQGGIYAMPFAAAFDLTTPAPTVVGGK